MDDKHASIYVRPPIGRSGDRVARTFHAVYPVPVRSDERDRYRPMAYLVSALLSRGPRQFPGECKAPFGRFNGYVQIPVGELNPLVLGNPFANPPSIKCFNR